MFYDKDKKEYYCIRCQFHGTEKEVLAGNEIIRWRYKDMHKRYALEDFYKN